MLARVRRLGIAPVAAIVMVAVMALVTVVMLGRGELEGSRDAIVGWGDADGGRGGLEEFAEREFTGYDFEFEEFGDEGGQWFRMSGDVDTGDEVLRINGKLGDMTGLAERSGADFLIGASLRVSREAAPAGVSSGAAADPADPAVPTVPTGSAGPPGTAGHPVDGRPPLTVTLSAFADPDELRGLLDDERVWELRSLDVTTEKGYLLLWTAGCAVADDACFAATEALAVDIETAPYRLEEQPGVGHISVYVPILDAAMPQIEIPSGARSAEEAAAVAPPSADIHVAGPNDRGAAMDAFRRYFPWLQPMAAVGMTADPAGRPVRIKPLISVGVDGSPTVQLIATGNENEEDFAQRAEELANDVLDELARLTDEATSAKVTIGWDGSAEFILGGCSPQGAADALEERMREKYEECG